MDFVRNHIYNKWYNTIVYGPLVVLDLSAGAKRAINSHAVREALPVPTVVGVGARPPLWRRGSWVGCAGDGNPREVVGGRSWRDWYWGVGPCRILFSSGQTAGKSAMEERSDSNLGRLPDTRLSQSDGSRNPKWGLETS